MSDSDMADWHAEMLCWHDRVMDFGALMSLNSKKKLLLWMFNEISKASQSLDDVSSYHIDLSEACYLLAVEDRRRYLLSAVLDLYEMLGISVIKFSPKNGRTHTTILMEYRFLSTDIRKDVLTGFIVYIES